MGIRGRLGRRGDFGSKYSRLCMGFCLVFCFFHFFCVFLCSWPGQQSEVSGIPFTGVGNLSPKWKTKRRVSLNRYNLKQKTLAKDSSRARLKNGNKHKKRYFGKILSFFQEHLSPKFKTKTACLFKYVLVFVQSETNWRPWPGQQSEVSGIHCTGVGNLSPKCTIWNKKPWPKIPAEPGVKVFRNLSPKWKTETTCMPKLVLVFAQSETN